MDLREPNWTGRVIHYLIWLCLTHRNVFRKSLKNMKIIQRKKFKSIAKYSIYTGDFFPPLYGTNTVIERSCSLSSVRPVLHSVRTRVPACKFASTLARKMHDNYPQPVRSSFINRPPPPGWHSNYRRSRFRFVVILVSRESYGGV